MDGLSVAASIVGIATAGVQVSIKLVNIATQISTASDRVSSIGNDISLTSGVLHQLGELMKQKTTDGGISMLNQHGLETTRTSAAMCERIFHQVEKEVKRASEQLRKHKPDRGRMSGEKIELSTYEKAKWPFLQPNIDILRADLRDAKSTLMLMLQVASLALSKRMADASISTTEHQDFVRAIVALEIQRREEQKNSPGQQEGSKSSSSNDTPDIVNANTVLSGEGTLDSDRNPRPSHPWVKPGRNAGANQTRQDPSYRQVESLLDPSIGFEVGQPRGLETENVVKQPLRAHIIPQTDRNSNVPEDPTVNLSRLSLSPYSDGTNQTNHNTELQLFLLKPTVKDFFDRIELHWTVQNTNMRPLVIREHMAKNEKNGLPSVVEMLQQLHAYEQAMVDSETHKFSGGSVLSLKRTKTDIHCRDMLFKAVPVLQFVVQRQVSPPRHLAGSISKASRHRRSGLASVLTLLRKKKTKETRDSTHSSSSFSFEAEPTDLEAENTDLPFASFAKSAGARIPYFIEKHHDSHGDHLGRAGLEQNPDLNAKGKKDKIEVTKPYKYVASGEGVSVEPPVLERVGHPEPSKAVLADWDLASAIKPESDEDEGFDTDVVYNQWAADDTVDSQEDKDAEAMVADLLATYTILLPHQP